MPNQFGKYEKSQLKSFTHFIDQPFMHKSNKIKMKIVQKSMQASFIKSTKESVFQFGEMEMKMKMKKKMSITINRMKKFA
jgi:hypothetical protein